MSLDDVYNLQVEAMNKVTKEDWINEMKEGDEHLVDLDRVTGYDRVSKQLVQRMCLVRNDKNMIHAHPCLNKKNQ